MPHSNVSYCSAIKATKSQWHKAISLSLGHASVRCWHQLSVVSSKLEWFCSRRASSSSSWDQRTPRECFPLYFKSLLVSHFANALLANACHMTEKLRGGEVDPAQFKPKLVIGANPTSREQEVSTSQENEGEGMNISEQQSNPP